jgi:hypothetical protein
MTTSNPYNTLISAKQEVALTASQAAAVPQRDIVATVFCNLLAMSLILLAINSLGLLDQQYAMVVIPITLLACCSLAAFKLIQRRPITLLTTYPWVLLVIGLFHGLGSLAPIMSNRETQAYISGSYAVTPDRLLRTNTLNLVGLSALSLGVLFGHSLGSGGRAQSGRNVFRQIDSHSAAAMAKVALGIGLPVLFLLRLPAQFGWLPFVVPGSIQQLASFVHVALIILAYLTEKKYPNAAVTLCAIVPVVLLSETIVFSKEASLMVVIMPFIGFFLGSRKLSRLFWGGVCCAAAYVLLVPVVNEARLLLAAQERSVVGEIGVPLSKRMEVLGEAIDRRWMTSNVVVTPIGRIQFWWSRLCYNNVQAFGMNQYDQGNPGDSLKHSIATLVPRVLWPNKPITAMQGIEFQQLFTGRWHDNRTSVGIGVFGEGYWIGGWWGVVLVSIGIGIQLAIMSNLVFLHERRGDVMAFIFCFLYGIITARAFDKWIVMSYIGNIPIYVALYLVSMLAARYTASRAMQPVRMAT